MAPILQLYECNSNSLHDFMSVKKKEIYLTLLLSFSVYNSEFHYAKESRIQEISDVVRDGRLDIRCEDLKFA